MTQFTRPGLLGIPAAYNEADFTTLATLSEVYTYRSAIGIPGGYNDSVFGINSNRRTVTFNFDGTVAGNMDDFNEFVIRCSLTGTVAGVGEIGNRVPNWPQFNGVIDDIGFYFGNSLFFETDAYFSDLDNDIVSYSLVGDWPEWAFINPATGLITGAGQVGNWPALQVRATDFYGAYAESNEFKITVAAQEVQIVAEDIDRIDIEHKGRVINEKNSLEVIAYFFNEAGYNALPAKVEYRVDDAMTGEVMLGWTVAEPVVDVSESGALAACYININIPGSVNTILGTAKEEDRYLLVATDRDADNEYSIQWKFTVRNLTGRV
jgi:hypothetical protein